MRFFAPLRGRVGAVAALVAVHAALAWALAAAASLPALAPLARHPRGAWALYAEGGRLALDLARENRAALAATVLFVALALGLHALAWLFLGGLLPALFVTPQGPALHRAASYSLRRAPTLLALALAAGVGYGLAGLAAVFGSEYGERRALLLADERAGDLQQVWALLPALVLWFLVSAWHDVARVQAVGEGAGAGPAAVGATGRLLREPLKTLGAAAGYQALAALGPLAALGAAALWGGRPGAALGALVLAQQLALAWRTICRALWFAHLARPWREGARPQRS